MHCRLAKLRYENGIINRTKHVLHVPRMRVLYCTKQSRDTGSTNWNIQKGTPEDQDIIAQMIRREKMNPIGLNPTNFLLAKNQDEEVLAIGQIEKRQNPDYYEIRSICVNDSARGQGFGSIIMTALLNQASPANPIYLLTLGRSISFYEKFGFEEITPWNNVPMCLVLEWCLGLIAGRLAENDRCLIMKKTKSNENPII